MKKEISFDDLISNLKNENFSDEYSLPLIEEKLNVLIKNKMELEKQISLLKEIVKRKSSNVEQDTVVKVNPNSENFYFIF